MAFPRYQLDDNGWPFKKSKQRKWVKRQHNRWLRRTWRDKKICLHNKQFSGWAL